VKKERREIMKSIRIEKRISPPWEMLVVVRS
jgi:hypothetical protein